MPKCYISVPVEQTKNLQQTVNTAKKFLELEGYDPVSPFLLGNNTAATENLTHLGTAILESCDCIYMLKGWETSQRATDELYLARQHKLQVMYEGKPMPDPWPSQNDQDNNHGT